MKATPVNPGTTSGPTVNPLSAVLWLPRVAAMAMVMVRRVRTRGAIPAARFLGGPGAAEVGLAPAL
jgi:hypothetical protein